jgi:hypothetical protein
MKKLNLGNKQKLSKEQMKKINGGLRFECWILSGYGSEGYNTMIPIYGDIPDCAEAQAVANYWVTTDEGYYVAPWGIDCEC